jgi:hypothetical protein
MTGRILRKRTETTEELEYDDISTFFKAIGKFLSVLNGRVSLLEAQHKGNTNFNQVEFIEAHTVGPEWFERIDDMVDGLFTDVKALLNKKETVTEQ